MKRPMPGMTSLLNLALEAAAPVSGGSPAPAASAPAPAPAAPAAPAPSTPAPTKGGFFQGLKRASVPADKGAAAEEPQKPAAAAPAAEPAKPEAGAPPAPAAPAKDPAAAPAAADAAIFTRPFFGRAEIKTQEQAEGLLKRSQDEGIRLHGEVKTLGSKIASLTTDFEARIAGLNKELEQARATPAQPDLNEQQLADLWKENPSKAYQYQKDRDARSDQAKSERDSAEKAVRDRAEAEQRGTQEAIANWEAMGKDQKAYPMFGELEDRMNAIYEKSKVNGKSHYDSNPDAPRQLYLQAMGEVFVSLQQKGKSATDEAAEAARKKAAADAAAGNPAPTPGDPTTADNRTPAEKEQAQWRERMRSSGKPSPGARIFKTRGNG